jgi:hypothetical protein
VDSVWNMHLQAYNWINLAKQIVTRDPKLALCYVRNLEETQRAGMSDIALWLCKNYVSVVEAKTFIDKLELYIVTKEG